MTRDEFIEGNLPLVHKLANRFRGRGVEYEELYAAGCVGLVKAVDRFEPERGLCFSTYAVPVILGEIRRLFRDGGSVKISRSLKELSVKAARLRDQLSANGEPRISDIAQALGVTPEEAAEALCAGIPPVSLDHGGDDGEPLPVPSASGEDALIDRLALRQCLSELSGEDRRLLELLDPSKTVAVVNKSDLPQKLELNEISAKLGAPAVISAKSGENSGEPAKLLEKAVSEKLDLGRLDPDAGFLANERQRDCIIRADRALNSALEAAQLGVTPDAVGVMLEEALDAVYELSGKRAGDEVIDEVFRRFCVGK